MQGKQVKWCVVVATAPRKVPTVIETLESLEDCGWSPTVFAEPGSIDTGRATIWNEERLGVWRNWVKSCIWALDQEADLIMTVQDDTEFHPESRALVESIEWPEDAGYISLYTPKHYQQWKDGRPRPVGFYPVKTNSMWGAMALVFKPDVLARVISHPRALDWCGVAPKNKESRAGYKERRKAEPWKIQNSDFIIASILLRNLKRKLYYFNPSPCTHISKFSSIGHGDNSGRRNAYYVAARDLPLTYQIFPTSEPQ
jgi:hypothetical protein